MCASPNHFAAGKVAETLTWKWRSWSRLTTDELYRILAIRVGVFVVEQCCPYQELDGKDMSALHLFAESTRNSDSAIAAYLRVLPPGLQCQEATIGRILVAQDYRGAGLARLAMETALVRIRSDYPDAGVRLSAQLYLAGFYQDLGFRPLGESYDEDGIEHIDMLLSS